MKEETLAKPCQAEVMQFAEPNRFVLLFFRDDSKDDLLTSTWRFSWKQIQDLATELLRRFEALNIDEEALLAILRDYREIKRDVLFSTRLLRNVHGICFPQDPRVQPNHLMCNSSRPKNIASLVFDIDFESPLHTCC
jgi:hypothetical protein